MDSTVAAAMISSISAIVVCVISNWIQSRKAEKVHQDNIALISYRLEQLEQKVDRHNNHVERIASLERRADVLEEKQRVANHRIDDIERHLDDGK